MRQTDTAGDVLLDALAERIAARVGDLLDARATKLPPERISLTLDEAAEALGISRATVQRLIDAGQLRDTRMLGRRMVAVDELRRFASEGATA